MKKFIKDYLTFSSRDRNGILVLIFVILIIAILKHFKMFDPGLKETDYSMFEKEILEFERSLEENNKATIYKRKDKKEPIQYFDFDPNNTSREEWLKLGLKRKQVNTICKYLSKGGRFYKKSDLKKIYGIDSCLYNKLAPYIYFTRTDANKKMKMDKSSYNINSIDSSGLVKVKGIGKVLSIRILKYRKLLGGFVDKNQLKEVYGINDSLYMIIEKQFYLDTSLIRKLPVNKATEFQLRKHPYISSYEAKAIKSYVKYHREITSLQELLEQRIVKQDKFNKISPYLSVN